MRHLSILLALALPTLAACAASPAPAPATPPATTAPPAAGACVGSVEAHDGLKEVDDAVLLKDAHGDPGAGRLCMGKAFEVVKPLKVYRVWDKNKAYTQTGQWWSFSKPEGPREAYRVANEVCTAWSPLDTLSECTLKVGSHVVVGPGQSANCPAGSSPPSYPASATNQVFVENDTKSSPPRLFVENCTAGAPWP